MSKELMHISDWLEMHGENRDPSKIDLFENNPHEKMMQIFADLGVVFDPPPDHYAKMTKRINKKYIREALKRGEPK